MERKPTTAATATPPKSAQRKSVAGERAALGCLSLIAFCALTGLVSFAIAQAPWLRYLLVVLAMAVAGAAFANRPPGVRAFFAEHTMAAIYVGSVLLIGWLAGQAQLTNREDSERAAAAQRETERIAAEHRANEERQREDQLRKNADGAVATLKARTEELLAKVSAEDWDAVLPAMVALDREVAPYSKLGGLPPAMTEAREGAKQAMAAATPIARTRDVLRSVGQQLEGGRSQQSGGEYIAAQASYQAAVAALDAIAEEHRRYLPEHRRLLSEATGLERRVHGKAEQQRKKREREAAKAAKEKAEQEMLWAVCGGQAPLRSPWDNSYVGAKRYLESVANDPDSIDMETCTTAVLTDKCWRTTCAYRGKNAFGALIRNESTFYIAKDNQVVGMK